MGNKFKAGSENPGWRGGRTNIDKLKRYKRIRLANKQRAVQMLGGRCIVCGYSKCLAALDFHHKDPKIKTGQMGQMIRRAWHVLEKELVNCVLLCANCHREFHQTNFDIQNALHISKVMV